MRRAGVVGLLTLVCVVVTAPPVAPAEPDAARLFILPVKGSSTLAQDERRLLEARVGLAVGRSRRLRMVETRDISPNARLTLPADLTTCSIAPCLRRLGEATGATRVLALELLDDGPESVLFATLFDTRTGVLVERREFAHPSPASRLLAEEIARWVVRAWTPSPAPAADETGPPPPPVGIQPRLVVEIAPGQANGPEAVALVAQLASRLAARRHPQVATGGGAAPDITHRARIGVDKVAVSQRPHHARHYRTGQLAATLTISDARGGSVIFSHRGSAEATARARHATERQILDVLVDEVVSRWMWALDDQDIDRLLQRSLPPLIPQPINKRGTP